MQIHLPALQENHWHYLLGSVVFMVTAYWLRQELTPKKFITLFESENSLSLRLVLAAMVVVFTLLMQAADRLDTMKVEANYTFAGLLLGLGVAKLVGKAFAERPGDTTVKTKNTNISGGPISVEGDVSTQPAPEQQPLAGYSNNKIE